MTFESILNTVESHISEYETAVANALANFHGVSGGLAALQRTLGVLTPIVESLAPASAPILDALDAVVTDINTLAAPVAVAPVIEAAPIPAEAPVTA